MPSIYPWLRNHCLAINNTSLLVSADMSHVPVAWQRPGWNIHISSDISALWAECHIYPCLYSSLYLFSQIKEGNETILRFNVHITHQICIRLQDVWEEGCKEHILPLDITVLQCAYNLHRLTSCILLPLLFTLIWNW
jgi:hypothetical protein